MTKVLVEQLDLEGLEERREWQCERCGATVIDVKPPVAGVDCPVCLAVKAGKHTPSALYPIGQEMGIRVSQQKPISQPLGSSGRALG